MIISISQFKSFLVHLTASGPGPHEVLPVSDRGRPRAPANPRVLQRLRAPSHRLARVMASTFNDAQLMAHQLSVSAFHLLPQEISSTSHLSRSSTGPGSRSPSLRRISLGCTSCWGPLAPKSTAGCRCEWILDITEQQVFTCQADCY